MEEIFKNIYGYEGLYQISNLGRVKSLNYRCTKKEKVLKPCKNTNGYLQVHLYKDSENKYMLVHRLVADAFISNPYNLSDVNHKDEDKTNNCVSNLEWCTREYNCNFGSRNERSAKSRSKLLTGVYNTKLSKSVRCIETNQIFPSTMEVQRQLGFAHCSIVQCCNGKLKSAYGYHWKYL